jgi:formylglycine-generating enzyme required for sulfatase activity
MPQRRGFFLVLGMGILLSGLTGLDAPAQQPAEPKGKKYALLIGVQDYDVNELHSLNFAEADVSSLAETLRLGGYEPGNIVLLTQTVGAKKARFLPAAGHIKKELDLLLADLDRDDSVLIAFAGHGVQFQGEDGSYFCPMDAKLTDRSTLIPFKDVYAKLEKCGAGLKVLLVDACRNDPRTKTARARAEVDLESVTRPQVTPPPGGVLAFFGCSAGEKTQENEEIKHGVFFYFVNQGVKGEADLDHDNQVSPEELAQFAKKRVWDFVREKNGIRQMPELVGTARDLSALVTLKPEAARLDLITTKTAGIRLKLIPAGEFQMGSADDDKDAFNDEKPQHRVRITKPFYLGVTEVTRGQFRVFVDDTGYKTEAEKDGKGGYGWNEETKKFEQNARYTWQSPGFEQTDEHPVVNVSWNDAQAFIGWLSQKEGKTFRLPTEAEWEYACRARTTTRYFCGDDREGLAAVGNVADSTAREKYPDWTSAIAARDGYVYTAPVGRFKANAFGLYDMHGNVWEWCQDRYDGEYYKRSPVDDPPGPSGGASFRVFRGGGWSGGPGVCRTAYRNAGDPSIRSTGDGFRLALVQSGR